MDLRKLLLVLQSKGKDMCHCETNNNILNTNTGVGSVQSTPFIQYINRYLTFASCFYSLSS